MWQLERDSRVARDLRHGWRNGRPAWPMKSSMRTARRERHPNLDEPREESSDKAE